MDKVILFGAGRIGRLVYSEVLASGTNQLYKEIFFYDNDRKKQGTYINGIYILTYEKLIEIIHTGSYVIILATDYWIELLDFCRSIGIENKIISVYNSSSFRLNPYARNIYGQDAEEVYLSEKIGKAFGSEYKGFYVDIGAHHPYRFSNTYWAYKRGWHGINIEPNSDVIALFNKIRDKDININCGIGIEEKIMKYFKFEESAFNTFDEDEYKGLRVPKNVQEIPVRTLKSVFDEYKVKKVDFINIDVEGFEMQVLQSNDWDRYKPYLILVEQKNLSVVELVNSEIYSYLKNIGYECEWKGIRTAIYKQIE